MERASPAATIRALNSPGQVLFASLIGTTIEFFDFYIYATAAVLVFPRLFFPKSDPASATLASLATFAIAFLARPIGSALFGHFGDHVGCRAPDDGRVHGDHRRPAYLRHHRHRGAAVSRTLPLRSGPWARRRMG